MAQSDFVSRGQALVVAGQYQEAVKVCRLGLLGQPATVEGRVVLASALLALKRYDEVLAETRVAIEIDPTSVPAQSLKGEALLRKGDYAAALETLQRARQVSPADTKLNELFAEAQRGGTGKGSASMPAAQVRAPAPISEGKTVNYPQHGIAGGDEDSFTGATSLKTKATSKGRTKGKDRTPSPEVPGDKSGTVEVDPETDGIEVDDEDFGEVAAPPVARGRSGPASPKVAAKPPAGNDIDETNDRQKFMRQTMLGSAPGVKPPPPGPVTTARNAVGMPAGPLGEPRTKPPSMPPPHLPAPHLPASHLPASHLPPPSQLPMPSPLQPIIPPSRHPIAAAMPTIAALPPPPQPHAGFPPPAPMYPLPAPPFPPPAPPLPLTAIGPPGNAALRPTELAQAQPMPPQAGAQPWAQKTVLAPNARSAAAALEPTAKPDALDPALLALLAETPSDSGQVAVLPEDRPKAEEPKPARKPRSTASIVLWLVVGVVVIGGGVVAGFQIRSVRLRRDIASARDHAAELAHTDTWAGWVQARNSLAGIVAASPTIENRAALARARATIAFAFGDGVAEAKAAASDLAGRGGLDGDVASAFVALSDNDVKTAKVAADAAQTEAPQDPAALYLVGEASAADGDLAGALTSLRAALDKDRRPLYAVAVAHALATRNEWDDAISVLDKALATSADNPLLVIERASVLAASGKVGPGSAIGNETRAQLEKVLSDGAKPPADQKLGVSPAEVAFGQLAMSRLDFARGDGNAARGDLRAAAAIGLEDQRFAEDAIETLFVIGELGAARSRAEYAVSTWPTSRRARIVLAEVALEQGKPTEALDVLSKQADVVQLALGQAVRGEARLATDDVDSARGDFDAALKKLPNLELALVGRAWLDLRQGGDVAAARKRIEAHYNAAGASPALATVYAALLAASADIKDRLAAKDILSKVVQGTPGAAVARAQLELAAIDRDTGDIRAARALYIEAAKQGLLEARVALGNLQLENRDPAAGRDTFEALLKDVGDHPSPNLMLDVARARALLGDHSGAAQMLDAAEKTPGVTKWKLDRERGRLALRKNDFAGAGSALARALETCGTDEDTWVLAADTATADDSQRPLVEKLEKLAPDRLKGLPLAQIIAGKLLLDDNKIPEAEAAFKAARDGFEAAHASDRSKALASFGLAGSAYFRKDDPTALDGFDLVREQDPTLYVAYVFAAELIRDRKPNKALELAQKSVMYNPDYIDGWDAVGKAAAKAGNKAVLADAIGKLGALAPNSDLFKELAAMKK